MSHLEKAIEQLKSDGHTSEEIQCALALLEKQTKQQPIGRGSLDSYLDGLDDQGNNR